MQKNKRKDLLCRIALLLLFLGIAAFACLRLWEIYAEYAAGEDSYAALASQYTQLSEPPVHTLDSTPAPPHLTLTEQLDKGSAAPEMETGTAEVPLEITFPALLQKYSDVVGWLFCDGTPVNYPVVQGPDNAYYLRRLLDGTYNKCGSLFLDYRNAPDFSDYHSIIYGHNMNNDSMFGTLQEYQKQSYYEAHPLWYLLTPTQSYVIELIGGYTTKDDAADTYTIPDTPEGRDLLIQTARQSSTFQLAEEPVIHEDTRIITFSTCVKEYDATDERYVLVGILRPE